MWDLSKPLAPDTRRIILKYVIVIPSGGGDKLDVCLDSIDPEIRKNVLIYENAPQIKHRDDVLGYGGTGGWNYGVNYVIDNKLDYVIIVSQNVVFTDGMRDFIDRLSLMPEYGIITPEGWHCIALSRKTLELVGEFDTNFYPIYYEDTDYELRLYKHGIIEAVYEVPLYSLRTPGGYSTTLGLRPNVEKCKEYFIKKWGVIFDYTNYENQAFYDHPFDDPTKPLDYYEKKTTDQLIEECGFADRKHDLYIEELR